MASLSLLISAELMPNQRMGSTVQPFLKRIHSLDSIVDEKIAMCTMTAYQMSLFILLLDILDSSCSHNIRCITQLRDHNIALWSGMAFWKISTQFNFLSD